MDYQSTLGSDQKRVSEASVFYRQVKSKNRLVEPDKETISGRSNLEAVDELLKYIKRQKLRYPVNIEDTEMDELHKELAVDLLKGDGSIEQNVKMLLSQFCDSLTGAQRQEHKYAMLLDFGSAFLLAHIRAERGISITGATTDDEEEQIQLIRRFLDVDNILSAALFETRDGGINISHFTDPGSDSFRDFVGVSERNYHYQKKNVQIVTYYNDQRDYECKFEFSNGELESLWLTDNKINLTEDHLVFSDPDRGTESSHKIKDIRWGRTPYTSVNIFKSDFKEFSYDVDGEFRRYQRLLSAPSESTVSIFDDEVDDIVDFSEKVQIEYENGKVRTDQKGELLDHLHSIFASGNIELDSGFAGRIYQDIINNRDCIIYHASEEAASDELVLGQVSFLNIEKEALSDEVQRFLTTIHEHMLNATGESLTRCLCFVLLKIISEEANRAYKKGLRQLININEGRPKMDDVVTTREGEGEGLIEYKNRQDLERDDPDKIIVDRIQTELRQGNDMKVFLWGVTEQNRNFDGLSTQKWNDDRISSIEDHVWDQIENENLEVGGFEMRPIPLGKDGEKWIVAGILY